MFSFCINHVSCSWQERYMQVVKPHPGLTWPFKEWLPQYKDLFYSLCGISFSSKSTGLFLSQHWLFFSLHRRKWHLNRLSSKFIIQSCISRPVDHQKWFYTQVGSHSVYTLSLSHNMERCLIYKGWDTFFYSRSWEDSQEKIVYFICFKEGKPLRWFFSGA